MTPEELSRLLLEDKYLVLDIPSEEFPELNEYLVGRAYTYYPEIGQLRIKMATQMHATVSDWALQLIMAGVCVGAFGRGDLCLLAEGRMRNFRGDYQNIEKAPDIALVPGDRFWPTIVFEFGYAEPYEHLKNDVKLMLEGSEGAISRAIIIKLQPLGDDIEIKKGFVEMWHFIDGKAKRVGGTGRKTLFPPPKSHEDQKLELSLGDILRSEFRNLAKEGWEKENTIDLYLDHLREAINKATTRHLIAEGVLPEPSLHDSDSDNSDSDDSDTDNPNYNDSDSDDSDSNNSDSNNSDSDDSGSDSSDSDDPDSDPGSGVDNNQ